MFTQQKAKLTQIKSYLTRIYGFVELSKSEGLTDDSSELEDLAVGLLNILFGCNLVNLNRVHKKNYPAVDIGDENLRRAFQVTSDDTKAKISDSLKKFDKHSIWMHFDKPEFIVFSFKKRKPDSFETNSNFIFTPNSDIFYISDLYNEIAKREDLLDDIIGYFENNLDSLIGVDVSKQSIEMIVFRTLFSEIAKINKENSKNLTVNLTEQDDSDLKLKSSRFTEYWALIEQNYAAIIDTSKEKVYATVEKNFSEDDLISMKEYLKLNSRKCLHEAKNNPIKGIELLMKKITSDLNLQFVSETEIEYFLYYQLYYCFVFPN
jgi:hypothetical protein